MSENLNKLKSLGIEKIHEDTHIPKESIGAILDENYEKLTHVQFFGFFSILEREYNIDLEDIKSHALEYYDEQEKIEHSRNNGIFVTPSKQKNFTSFYFILALVVFLLALGYTINVTYKVKHIQTPLQTSVKSSIIPEANNSSTTIFQAKIISKKKVEKKIEKKVIKIVMPKVKVIPTVVEVNSSQKEQNLTKERNFLEILPRSKVWLGYINVTTDKKRQKTFSNELDLNASKEWLFIFGHGYIDVLVNGEKIHFSDKHTLRLHYKDGVLEKVSIAEFKKLNRGSKW